jgi:hypothetical protein
MVRHQDLSAGTNRQGETARDLVDGTFRKAPSPPIIIDKELITQRSRVQIPPPLLQKTQAPPGFSPSRWLTGSDAHLPSDAKLMPGYRDLSMIPLPL